MNKLILVFAGILLSGALARAAEPIGLVMSLKGPVTVTGADGTARKIEFQSKIFLNDTIVTGAKAKIEILFTDDTRFSLGENSEMTMDEYIYNPGKKDENKFGAKLKKGLFHTITGKIPVMDPDGFKVKTSRSTIGIRGCELGFQISESSEIVFIVEISPGNRIFVGTVADPQGQTFEAPCALTINNEGAIKLIPLTPEMINRIRQTSSLNRRRGSQQGGQDGNSGGGKGHIWHNPFHPGWITPGDGDLPATRI